MNNVKGLPAKCKECTCSADRGLRSCRNYKCSFFPQRESVCAAEELSRALERFSTRLDSAFRAKNENELHSHQIESELLSSGRRTVFDMLHSPEILETVRSALIESADADEKTAVRLLNELLNCDSYSRFHGASLMFAALTGINIESPDVLSVHSESATVPAQDDTGSADDKEEDTPFVSHLPDLEE